MVEWIGAGQEYNMLKHSEKAQIDAKYYYPNSLNIARNFLDPPVKICILYTL